eukprot:9127415-Pyramimonas_sp.AAC.1
MEFSPRQGASWGLGSAGGAALAGGSKPLRMLVCALGAGFRRAVAVLSALGASRDAIIGMAH